MKGTTVPEFRNRTARRVEGQATVEFALLLMLLMTIAFGAIEVGRILSAWSTVQYVARDGARTASVTCAVDPDCQGAVQARVVAGLEQLPPDSVARWSMSDPPYVSGATVTVRVEYDFVPGTPLASSLVSSWPITVVGSASMRVE